MEYAAMPEQAQTFQSTGELRQVVDANQGFIGVQQQFLCLETGKREWRWIESVTMQEAIKDVA